jgi:hypothetical protein
MSVFISYSSRDSEFANNLALHLVKNKVHVWIDKWELKAGDSLIDKIQDALVNSSFLLVLLSKNSVESEWCKKELNSGLIREIESKSVVIIPILIEKCDIPIFLKEKLYADFTKSFDEGISQLMKPLSKLIVEYIGRNVGDFTNIDYAVSLSEVDGFFFMQIDTVVIYPEKTFSALIQTFVTGDEKATQRWKEQEKIGLSGLMKEAVILSMIKSENFKKIQLYLRDEHPYTAKYILSDERQGFKFSIIIRARLLGENPGNDKLLSYIDILKVVSVMRKDLM